MSDEDSLEELPDAANALYALATTGSVFAYEREAAIKKLAALENDLANAHLSSLATGEALTLVEQELATAKAEEDLS